MNSNEYIHFLDGETVRVTSFVLNVTSAQTTWTVLSRSTVKLAGNAPVVSTVQTLYTLLMDVAVE